MVNTTSSKAWWTGSQAQQKAWLHRDRRQQEGDKDKLLIKHTNAFSLPTSYQSSVYFEPSLTAKADGFICVLKSHTMQDRVGWSKASDRHAVNIPVTALGRDLRISKLLVNAGDCLIWDSNLVHMGGSAGLKRPRDDDENAVEIDLVELDAKACDDYTGIKAALAEDGVARVKEVASALDIEQFKSQLSLDVSKAYGVTTPSEWYDLPSHVFGRLNKGGGAWSPVCTTQAAWRARLLPKRVAIFQHLYPRETLVVSIDSLHWNPVEGARRLCSMASFSPERYRSDEARKRKALCQASGRARTTHEAELGQPTTFGYGAERMGNAPQQRIDSLVPSHRGFGCAQKGTIPWRVLNMKARHVAKAIQETAREMTIESCKMLLEEDVWEWL